MAIEVIQRGATGASLPVTLRSNVDGSLVSRVATDAGASAYYQRDNEAPVAIALTALGSLGAAHTAGGFVPVDVATAPGVHRFDLPDAIANGTPSKAVVVVTFDGVVAWKRDIRFTNYDPADAPDIRAELEASDAVLGRLSPMIEDDGAGANRYTMKALEQAPTGGTAVVDNAAIASAVRAEMEGAGTQLAALHGRLTDARATLLDNLTNLDALASDILAAANAAATDAGTAATAANTAATAAGNAETAASALGADLTAVRGATDTLAGLVGQDGTGNDRFTVKALELAPTSSGSGVTDWSAGERDTILSTLTTLDTVTAVIRQLVETDGAKLDAAQYGALAKSAELAGITVDTSGLADKTDVATIRGDIANVDATVDLTGIARTTDVTGARDAILAALLDPADLAAVRAVTDKLNGMLAQAGAAHRFTAEALADGPVADVSALATAAALAALDGDVATVQATLDGLTIDVDEQAIANGVLAATLDAAGSITFKDAVGTLVGGFRRSGDIVELFGANLGVVARFARTVDRGTGETTALIRQAE